MTFSFGQRITIPMRRINRILGIGFTSSDDPQEPVLCTIEKYWEDDKDPNSYKLRVVPLQVEDQFAYGRESFYSTDLRSLIREFPEKYVLEPMKGEPNEIQKG